MAQATLPRFSFPMHVRFADTDALGTMMNMKVAIITDMRICTR